VSSVHPTGAPTSLEFAERRVLLEVIEQNNGNMTQTAAQLRLSRNTLYRKLRRHGIPVGAGRFQRH
jgi:transcriptional regulator of acetoin/glycerol metabolism